MNINAVLAASGAFASRKPILKTLKLPLADGGETEITVHYLDLPAADVREMLGGNDRESSERFLARVLCNEDGSPALELEGDHGAKALKLKALNALVKGGLEVLGLGDTARADAKKD